VPGQKVLLPASPERVTLDPNRDGEAADIWLSRLSIVRPVSGGTASAEMRPASLLFAERGPDVQAHQDDHLGRGGASSARVQSNAGVRGLDQSWRLRPDHRGEAILVGRFESSQGPSEEVVQGPESPTQLWLGALPGGQATRPALPGQMRQWTYVRVYLPVLPARK
jgi:hypothetical protein